MKRLTLPDNPVNDLDAAPLDHFGEVSMAAEITERDLPVLADAATHQVFSDRLAVATCGHNILGGAGHRQQVVAAVGLRDGLIAGRDKNLDGCLIGADHEGVLW